MFVYVNTVSMITVIKIWFNLYVHVLSLTCWHAQHVHGHCSRVPCLLFLSKVNHPFTFWQEFLPWLSEFLVTASQSYRISNEDEITEKRNEINEVKQVVCKWWSVHRTERFSMPPAIG